MVWSSVLLFLALTAPGNGWPALLFAGMSAFGFMAAAALWWSYPRIAIASALIAWLPLPVDTWRRASLAIEFSGLGRPDARHSLAAFMIGFLFDQLFFLPLTVTILVTAWRLWHSRRTNTLIPDAVT